VDRNLVLKSNYCFSCPSLKGICHATYTLNMQDAGCELSVSGSCTLGSLPMDDDHAEAYHLHYAEHSRSYKQCKVMFDVQDDIRPAKGKKAIGAAGPDRTADLIAGLLTCKPHVTADVLVARRAGLVRLRSRVDMTATTKTVNMRTTTAMRILLSGFASEGSGSAPAVAPSPMVPTVDTMTAAHSAVCNLS